MTRPPYERTAQIIRLVAEISEKIGRVNAVHLDKPAPELRKKNRIKTIQSSLEIEGNSLTTEQVTALLENKRVIAPEKDILEVRNAIRVYELMDEFRFASLPSLYKAHRILMKGLTEHPGRLRTRNAGIVRGSKVHHLAPSPARLPSLMEELFTYLKEDEEIALIKSCVFHYELEFIHPFSDGNGRMGRLWQTLILKSHAEVFGLLPVETIIRRKQKAYYAALGLSDKSGKSNAFIEFMLGAILEALDELLSTKSQVLHCGDRLSYYKLEIKNQWFSRKDYLLFYKDITTATASRDLKEAVDQDLVEKHGEKNQSKYRFK